MLNEIIREVEKNESFLKECPVNKYTLDTYWWQVLF